MMTAVVTGSTKGIGKAVGIKLLENGYFVIFNYASDGIGAECLKNELLPYAGKFDIVKNDFSSEAAIDRFVEEIACRTGRGGG